MTGSAAQTEFGVNIDNAAAKPLVSVIMNGFNSARYLAAAIQSVLAQSYAHWELVFWDNCSEDESEQIVRAVHDPRIRFYRAPRRMTLAEGRNAAIAQARGAWLAFLDCDDLWAPDKLSRQLERLANDSGGGVGLIYARTLSFSASGPEGETTYRYEGRLLPQGRILRHLLLEGNLIPMVSALVSREAYDHVGGIPNQFTFAEDYWLFVAVAEQYRALCVQDPCCWYRVHEQSATYGNKLASHVESLAVLEQWGHALEPRELRSRRAVYHTLIGVEIIRSQGKVAAGIKEILLRGSLTFLLRGAISHWLRHFIMRRRPHI